MKLLIPTLLLCLNSFAQNDMINSYALATNGSSNGLASPLVAYYKLDETSGTIVDSKNAFNSTSVVGVTYNVTGKLNTAVQVANVSGNGINCGNHATLNLTSGTVSVWFQYTGGLYLVSDANNNTDRNGWALTKTGTNTFSLQLCSGAAIQTITTVSTFSTSTWYHFVATWNGTTVKLYINGTQDVSTSQTVTPAFTTNPLILGAGYDGSSMAFPFTGTIDEVGIWNTVLTQTQITTLYNSGTPFAYSAFN